MARHASIVLNQASSADHDVNLSTYYRGSGLTRSFPLFGSNRRRILFVCMLALLVSGATAMKGRPMRPPRRRPRRGSVELSSKGRAKKPKHGRRHSMSSMSKKNKKLSPKVPKKTTKNPRKNLKRRMRRNSTHADRALTNRLNKATQSGAARPHMHAFKKIGKRSDHFDDCKLGAKKHRRRKSTGDLPDKKMCKECNEQFTPTALQRNFGDGSGKCNSCLLASF